jgi:hypothetical protein
MYLALLLLFWAAQGRFYYLAAAYPMLYAGGAVGGERWLASVNRRWGIIVRLTAWTALLADAALIGAMALPLAPVDSGLGRFALQQNGDLREEFGWEELAETVARIHSSYPGAAILAANYGEAGAIDLYGPRFGLPPAISGVNSYWQRGYGKPPPETVIVLGFSRAWADSQFTACQVAGHAGNRFGVENEEARDHADIFVCHQLRRSWPEFWRGFQRFG